MTTKERWAVAAEIGDILGTAKTEVFKILAQLQEAGLVEKVLAKDEATISRIKEILNKDRQFAEPTQFEQNVNHINLALWAYGKIGDHQKAKVAFEKVIKMFE